MKRKHTASLLALFLGNFGIHRFYLGQAEWGLAYLALCCTGLPAVLGCIDGIRLAGMNPGEFDRLYNSGTPRRLGSDSSITQAQNITIQMPTDEKEASIGLEISRLHTLLKEGALTEEEFQVQKKRILGNT